MPDYNIRNFPSSRLATIDVCALGKNKHHIAALIEVDTTLSREKIKNYKRNTGNISYTAWILKIIGHTLSNNKRAAAFLKGNDKVIIFEDINISMLVEKDYKGEKIPFPVLIEKTNERSIESITCQLNDSKNELLTKNEIVLQRKTTRLEKLYYRMPGFVRRTIWRILLNNPVSVFKKMGNVSVTSVGMIGKVNGWFIPISIHPICFGLSSVISKAVVVNNKIEVREILNMTILIDHDIIDGALMARFIKELSKNIETGIFLN